jgi:hypothetical protein
MFIDFLDARRLVGTYTTMSGDLGIVRRRLVVDRPEIVGYAAGDSRREIVEAVFVTAEVADAAQAVLSGIDGEHSIAEYLHGRGIPFRLAHQPKVASAASSPSDPVRRTADAPRRHADRCRRRTTRVARRNRYLAPTTETA